jgi:adenine specific DNA methylase Mod
MNDTYKHYIIEQNLLCLIDNQEEMNSNDQVVLGPYRYNIEFNDRCIWVVLSKALVLSYLNERLELIR